MRRTNEKVGTQGSTGHSLPPDFAAAAILAAPGPGRSTRELEPKETIVCQGAPAKSVYYIRKGNVQLGVVSEQGRTGLIGILGAGAFFGEGCILGPSMHGSSALSMTPCTLVTIERDAMVRLLHEQPIVFEAFLRFLLARSVRIEADLLDQLFNSSERRLARALLQLTDFGADNNAEAVVPRLNQEVLAAKVGTTRSRVNFFMNKFRKRGLIEYDSTSSTLTVRRNLLNSFIDD